MSRNATVIGVLFVLGAIGFVQAELQEANRAPADRVVTVSNFPKVQTVDGTVSVGNLPLDASGNLLVAGGGVSNQVLDLVDGDVVVPHYPPATGIPFTWESEVFDTAAFNRIGIKVAVVDGPEITALRCGFSWQFDDEDFSLPNLTTNRFSFSDDPGANGITLAGGVRGVRARVVCANGGATFDQTLTDVKLLLRRE